MKIIAGGKEIDNIELVIFDRDGTLIDIYAYWSWMVNKRARLICERYSLPENIRKGLVLKMGVDDAGRRLLPEGPVGIKPREIVMKAASDYLNDAGIKVADEDIKQVFLDVDRMSLDSLKDIVKLIPGATKLLKDIKDSGAKLAIATTDKTGRARVTLESMGVASLFDSVMGADSVAEPKPSPEMIFKILRELQVEIEKAVMVGDAVYDVQMGANAGLKASIGVCTGINSREDLLRITPYVVGSVADMKVK